MLARIKDKDSSLQASGRYDECEVWKGGAAGIEIKSNVAGFSRVQGAGCLMPSAVERRAFDLSQGTCCMGTKQLPQACPTACRVQPLLGSPCGSSIWRIQQQKISGDRLPMANAWSSFRGKTMALRTK